MTVPNYSAFFSPVLQAIKSLGGSASIAELEERVPRLMGLTDADIAEMHDERRTKVQYRMAWARTYLKMFGVLGNSERAVWALTAQGREVDDVNPLEVVQFVRARQVRSRNGNQDLVDVEAETVATQATLDIDGESVATQATLGVEAGTMATQATLEVEAVLEQGWRDALMAKLRALPPDVFERLCQRLLRESGFVQVSVTGGSRDGGIDGVGIVRVGGLLSFPVIFQCKRYQGSVSSSVVRDFRGAMSGRAERGLILTTGSFTRDAKAEATRDGVALIDLVDGEQLLDKLKELRLGVEVRMVEEVLIASAWFDSL
jgi:restriction system protein